MNHILGLLDTLESIVLESQKVPLTKKVVVEEERVIELIDKIRNTVKSNGEVVQQSVSVEESQRRIAEIGPDTQLEELEKAKKIKKGAEDYAKYVLTNLQLTVTKMQNNLIKLEKNIESGRRVIDEKKESIESESNSEKINQEETIENKK